MTDDADVPREVIEDVATLVEHVVADYHGADRFFEGHTRPEEAVLSAMDLEPRLRAQYLTLTCVADHIHNVIGQHKRTVGQEGLWWVCGRLLREDPWLFEPAELVGNDRREELQRRFRRINLMDARDPDWWFRTASILYEEFDGDVRVLLREYDHDAVRVDAAVTGRYDFPGLRGRKVLPLWLRLMNDEINELRNLDEIEVPADMPVIRIIGELTGAEFDPRDVDDKATARRIWGAVCEDFEFTPVHVYAPVWLLDEYWDSGGREYVRALHREVRI